MKITSVEVGQANASGRGKRVVSVHIKLAQQPVESRRITVVVPEDVNVSTCVDAKR
jgi:hypothetical protein